MATLSELVVAITGNTAGLTSALGKAEKDTAGFATRAGGALAGFGKAAAAAAAIGGVALIGVGAVGFKLGGDLDSAFDAIRIGTGATGADLTGLQSSFRNVVKDIPADFGKASQVIADLNTRTGATGETLEGLSKQILEMSRITKTDAVANVALATRVFGDWGIASKDQAAALDKVFRASQATGIGVGDLQAKVVQFGAPLRAMNFSFDESIAMLGKWEREGVNSELVLSSMRIAMGKFADQNVPMRKGLESTIAQIQKLGPSAQATALAMDVFGARAGPDMAAAILEGRFALGDLLTQISGGKDTVLGLSRETSDFGERWTTFLNRASLAIEPFATAIFSMAGALLDQLAPAIEHAITAAGPFVTEIAERIPPALAAAGAAMAVVGAALGEIAVQFAFLLGMDPGAFGSEWEIALGVVQEVLLRVQETMAPVAAFIQENLNPILNGLAAVLVAVVVPAFVAWAIAAGAAAAATVAALLPVVVPLLALGAAVALMSKAWAENWGDVQGKVAAAWEFIAPILEAVFGELARFWEEIRPALMRAWDAISNKINEVMTRIGTVITEGLATVSRFWEENWGAIGTVIENAWRLVETIIRTGWAIISGFIMAGLQLLSGDWAGAWETIRATVDTVMTNIVALLTEIVPDMLRAAQLLGDAIFEGIVGVVRGLGAALIETIRNAIAAIDIDFGWIRISGTAGITFNIPLPTFGSAPGQRSSSPTVGVIPAAHGAEFVVPGVGGTDSRLVSMALTPGERVRVTTPGADGGGIDEDRLAAKIARALAGVALSVSVDDIHSALLRKQTNNASLGFT